jgi:hypothetical protein
MAEGRPDQFPSDHELLSLAGKQAAAKGDFKKAEAFWRLALEGLNKEEHARVVEGLRSGPEGIKDLKAGNPADDAGALLLKTAQLHSTDAPAAKKTYHRTPSVGHGGQLRRASCVHSNGLRSREDPVTPGRTAIDPRPDTSGSQAGGSDSDNLPDAYGGPRVRGGRRFSA